MIANASRGPFATDVPFAPNRVPFYYGWVVVGAATVGILFSIPGQTMGVSVFTDALIEATGLSRLALSNAYLVGTLLSAAVLPWAGRMLDRAGVRLGAMLAAAGLGAVVAGLSVVDGLAAGLAGGLGASVAAFGVLTALFFGIRFTGQGVLTLASNTMIGRWFDRRRGVATAVSGLFTAFGFAIAPRVLDAWIAGSGWRDAYREMAVIELVGMVGIAFLLFREDPEWAGLALDGRSDPAADVQTDEIVVTRREALGTRAFWALTLAVAWHGMALTGITFHIVDLGAEQGLTRPEAVGIFVPMAVVSTATGALAGWLADRWPIRRLLQIFLVSAAVGYAATTGLATTGGYGAAAIALGIAGGHFGVLTTVALPRFFGRRHLGTISGASMTGIVVGSAIGPSVLAASRGMFDSYAPALLAQALPPLLLLPLTIGLAPAASAKRGRR